MCSVDTWLRLWANWEARFSSRQPKRQVTSSAILPLYKRLLVVVAGRGEGRGSWFNTKKGHEGTVNGNKRKTPREERQIKHSQKVWSKAKKCWESLTVCKASNPSKSGDGNMRHIPIHAEGEGGGVCWYTGRSGGRWTPVLTSPDTWEK